jgi:hypothetical protein
MVETGYLCDGSTSRLLIPLLLRLLLPTRRLHTPAAANVTAWKQKATFPYVPTSDLAIMVRARCTRISRHIAHSSNLAACVVCMLLE